MLNYFPQQLLTGLGDYHFFHQQAFFGYYGGAGGYGGFGGGYGAGQCVSCICLLS